jgi:hypothetical protein
MDVLPDKPTPVPVATIRKFFLNHRDQNMSEHSKIQLAEMKRYNVPKYLCCILT